LSEYVLEHLREVLHESVIHSVTMLPVLFLIFLVVEVLSHAASQPFIVRVARHPVLGAAAAAALGLLPQCGFSVAATTMYLEGLIPMGSLIAAYVSTSDEAVPILISNPKVAGWVLPLLGTKLVWGCVSGIAINLGLLARRSRALKDRSLPEGGQRGRESQGHVSRAMDSFESTPHHPRLGCSSTCVGQRASLISVLSHALSRTTRIAAMVFVLSCLLNFAGYLMKGRIAAALATPGPLQILAASIVGLIPSCAASVALAESFSSGILSFSATLSGLTSNSGIGLLVLMKESRDKRNAVSVVVLLIVAAFLAGILTSMLM